MCAVSFLKEDHTNNPASLQDEESQDGSPTPPEWPSHARINKQHENGGMLTFSKFYF
jgi:hypothetical protein